MKALDPRLRVLTLALLVGSAFLVVAPRAFAYTALGGSLGDLGSPEAIVAVVVLVLMAVVAAEGVAKRARTAKNHRGPGVPTPAPGHPSPR